VRIECCGENDLKRKNDAESGVEEPRLSNVDVPRFSNVEERRFSAA
jgi:hypothetical protein